MKKKCKDGFISNSTGKGTCSGHGGMLFFNKDSSLLEKENKLWIVKDYYENTGRYPVYDSEGFLITDKNMSEKEYQKIKKEHYIVAQKLFKQKIPVKYPRDNWYKEFYASGFEPIQEDWDFIDSMEDLWHRQSYERFNK